VNYLTRNDRLASYHLPTVSITFSNNQLNNPAPTVSVKIEIIQDALKMLVDCDMYGVILFELCN
jgi:hypothetical protein